EDGVCIRCRQNRISRHFNVRRVGGLQFAGKFADFVRRELHLEHRELAVLWVEAGPLPDNLAMPEVEVWKDERLPDFVLVARLEDFAPLNQTAEPLAFLLDALLDQSPCDLAGRQR